ncbi:MAG: M48 family metalloprotease [Planctomycetota bacterium]|jgi:predicted Zn-dependent protease
MILIRLLLAGALVVAASCANQTDPVTGDPYYSPIGNDYRSQLAYVNKHSITQIVTVQDGGNLNEPGINAACQAIFEKIVAALPAKHRRDFQFDLKISSSADVNAYTYGAGLVRCNLGLIARCGDASEFAGIVAHELGHNSHDHVGQSIGRAAVSQSVLGLGGIAGRPGQLLGNLVGGDLARFTLTQYTRSQEQAADRRAVEYTIAAGIDPDGLARFFDRLEQEEKKGLRTPQLFQSHPYSGNRVGAIREQIATALESKTGDWARHTDAFRAAAERARKILPYYVALNQALQQDDLEVVLRAADDGIAALPTHAAFPFWKGAALYTQEKREEAVVALREAAKNDDGANFMIPFLQQMLELETGNARRAERAADRLIGLMPMLPHGYLIRGLARLELNRKDEAIADFNETIKRVPRARDRRELEKLIQTRLPEFKAES